MIIFEIMILWNYKITKFQNIKGLIMMSPHNFENSQLSSY